MSQKFVIIGPNSSGKSSLAESIANRFEGVKYYFATLPINAAYKQKILDHRVRRSKDWITYEASFKPDRDLSVIASILDTGSPLLIEGYSAWRFFSSLSFNETYSMSDLIELFSNSISPWIFVDSVQNRKLILPEVSKISYLPGVKVYNTFGLVNK